MNNTTGKHLDGIAWLRQRLADVITTPLGSRVMRRDYGSRLFELQDQPMSPRWRVQIYSATAEALADPVNGLPDFQLNSAEVVINAEGRAELTVQGTYTPTNELVKVEAIKL